MSRRVSDEEYKERLKEINPNILFLSKQGNDINYRCLVCGYEGTSNVFGLLRGCGCRECGKIKISKALSRTHEQSVRLLFEKAGPTYHMESTYKNAHTPVVIRHDICGGTFKKCFGNPINEKMCPYCYGNKVLIGFNDLWTTKPESAKLLADPNIGHSIRYGSQTKVDAVCPHCHKVSRKWVSQLDPYNFPCPYCSFTYPYPERLMINLLEQLGVDFIHDSSTPWSMGKRYDFLIGGDTICETHGGQHYSQLLGFGTYDDIKRNDKLKMELAIKNGIKNYIVIDCRKSNFDFIKKNILKSRIPSLYDISNVDWNRCKIDCSHKYTMDIIELFNNGVLLKDIANEIGVCQDTVRKILKNSSVNGLCAYDPQQSRSKNWFKSKDRRLA